MREALETRAPGPRPDLETIKSRIGGFSSAVDGTEGDSADAPARRGNRRRRDG
jgi:5-methyltetrahydrofolate--homocysteine methyltransferase